MAHKNGNRYQYPTLRLKIFPELDEREKKTALRVGILREGGIAQPRQTRNGAEVGRLSGTCLDDTRHVAIPLHVGDYRPVKRIEIIAVVTPDIGECLVLRMEKRIAGHNLFPIPQLPLAVETHPELFIPVDGFHDDIEHHREKAESPCLLHGHQTGDVKVGVQIVLALDLRVIIIEINAPLPGGTVDDMEMAVHILLVCFREDRGKREDLIHRKSLFFCMFVEAIKKEQAMIKIYGMDTCPDCTYVEQQIEGNDRYEVVDIGRHVKNLKEFLHLRDTSPAFEEARNAGMAGIPCFVLEDGTVTLVPEDAGLKSRPLAEGASCSLDGSGC